MTHDTSRWASFFDGYRKRPLEERLVFVKEMYALIVDFIRDYNVKSFIDVGAGTGILPIYLKKVFPDLRACALDVDLDVVNVMTDFYMQNDVDVAVYHADARSMPFLGKEFDLASSYGLMEHYLDDYILEILGEMGRIARFLAVGVPTERYVKGHEGSNVAIYGDERAESNDFWEGLFLRSGFSHIKSVRRDDDFWVIMEASNSEEKE